MAADKVTHFHLTKIRLEVQEVELIRISNQAMEAEEAKLTKDSPHNSLSNN